jgi:adenylate kinase family enzyme
LIIGVLGLIGSGKNTVGEILKKDYGFEQLSFANVLKDSVSVMFDWPRHLLEGDTDESRNFREKEDKFWSKKFNRSITPRSILQQFGTEVVRNNLLQNFWVYSLEKRMNKNKNYVLTDVRFKNEIEWLKSQNSTLIQIQRGIQPHWYSIALQAYSGNTKAREFMLKNIHLSEWDWIGTDVDFLIENDGSLEDLKEKVDSMLLFSLGSSTMHDLV